MKQRIVFGLLLTVLCGGCDHFRVTDPGLKIDVTRTGSEYVFSFKTCRGQRVGVPWINVTEGITGGSQVPPHCEVSASAPSVRKISDRWRYGTVPSGYVMQKCEPLRPGRIYEVQATGAAGGRRVFYIRNDGSVELREGSCT